MLKVVVLGYGELTQSIVLGILESGHKLVGVFRWDKYRPNRVYACIRDILVPDALLSIMRTHNIRDINAEKANSIEFKQEIQKLAPDVIIVGAWGEILRQDIINLPKVACINCHPSYLPAHRGSNPYVSVLMAGEKETGITFHLMTPEIDAGDILLQEKVSISNSDNAGSLKKKCAFTAKRMVPVLLNRLEKAELIPIKQDESKASYYRAVNEDDVIINWSEPAETTHNRIRAFSPKTGCYTRYGNDFLFIRSSEIVNLNTPVLSPGKILEKRGAALLVATGTPDKAILADQITVYGFLSRLWSGQYIKHKIQPGEHLL